MSSYSLTLLRGTSLGFTLADFPVLGVGIGLYVSLNCSGGNMVSSLTLSHFPVFSGGVSFFHWFINNLIKGAVGSAYLKISKSALLSLNHHNFSNTKPIYTK